MFELRLEAGSVLRTPMLMLFAGLAAVGAGCQTENAAPEVEHATAAIRGGTPDTEFTGVCGIRVTLPPDPDDPDPEPEPLYCSCTLVAERIVMTAAHCVEPNLSAENCFSAGEPPCIDDIDLRFGTSFDTGTRVALGEIRMYRYYNPETAPGTHDIAMIRLAEDPPGAPTPEVVTLNEQPLDSSLQGETMTFVGFGVTDGAVDDFGAIRKRVDATVASVSEASLNAGTAENTPCRGDDGGPGFYDFGAGPVQITINAPIAACNPMVRRTRVDVYLDSFIYPFIDGYVGACALDDVCVEDGCRTPDPDCDTTGCSLDGECVEDCPTRDFDCPLGVFPRGACTMDGECELGGRCIAAKDDPEFTYCTRPCEEDTDCPADGGDMFCNADSECEFTPPSPGSQGRPCGDSIECRSGICEEDICVTECTDDTTCPAVPEGEEPYRCLPSNVKDGASVCIGTIVTGGGGFCDASGIGGRGRGVAGGIAVLLLAALALVVTSRRRRA